MLRLYPTYIGAVLQIEHRIAKLRKSEFGASWVLKYQKREGYYNDPEGNVCRYAGVLLLDGNIYWSNQMFKVSAECSNITNRRYYDYGGCIEAWNMGKSEVQCKDMIFD